MGVRTVRAMAAVGRATAVVVGAAMATMGAAGWDPAALARATAVMAVAATAGWVVAAVG